MIYPDNWDTSAKVEEAEIDKTVLIAPFAYVMAGAKIGAWSIIGSYSVIGETCVIGDNVQVMAHVTMQAAAIERDVFIGPGVRILNVKHPQARFEDPKEDPVVICEGAVIGGGAVILPGVTIGPRAKVGAGAIVTRDLPADARVKGQAAMEY